MGLPPDLNLIKHDYGLFPKLTVLQVVFIVRPRADEQFGNRSHQVTEVAPETDAKTQKAADPIINKETLTRTNRETTARDLRALPAGELEQLQESVQRVRAAAVRAQSTPPPQGGGTNAAQRAPLAPKQPTAQQQPPAQGGGGTTTTVVIVKGEEKAFEAEAIKLEQKIHTALLSKKLADPELPLSKEEAKEVLSRAKEFEPKELLLAKNLFSEKLPRNEKKGEMAVLDPEGIEFEKEELLQAFQNAKTLQKEGWADTRELRALLQKEIQKAFLPGEDPVADMILLENLDEAQETLIKNSATPSPKPSQEAPKEPRAQGSERQAVAQKGEQQPVAKGGMQEPLAAAKNPDAKPNPVIANIELGKEGKSVVGKKGESIETIGKVDSSKNVQAPFAPFQEPTAGANKADGKQKGEDLKTHPDEEHETDIDGGAAGCFYRMELLMRGDFAKEALGKMAAHVAGGYKSSWTKGVGRFLKDASEALFGNAESGTKFRSKGGYLAEVEKRAGGVHLAMMYLTLPYDDSVGIFRPFVGFSPLESILIDFDQLDDKLVLLHMEEGIKPVRIGVVQYLAEEMALIAKSQEIRIEIKGVPEGAKHSMKEMLLKKKLSGVRVSTSAESFIVES